MADRHDEAAAVALGLLLPFCVLPGYLPSPTTAMMGGSDPERVQSLRTDEVIGGAVTMSVAAAVSVMADDWRIFWGAAGLLTIFVVRYEYALRKGAARGDTTSKGY